jgi:hypothetical protein
MLRKKISQMDEEKFLKRKIFLQQQAIVLLRGGSRDLSVRSPHATLGQVVFTSAGRRIGNQGNRDSVFE